MPITKRPKVIEMIEQTHKKIGTLKRKVSLIIVSFAFHHNSLHPFSDISAASLFKYKCINVYITKEIKIYNCSFTETRVIEEFLWHCICAIIPQEFSALVFSAYLSSRVQIKASSLSSVTKVQ